MTEGLFRLGRPSAVRQDDAQRVVRREVIGAQLDGMAHEGLGPVDHGGRGLPAPHEGRGQVVGADDAIRVQRHRALPERVGVAPYPGLPPAGRAKTKDDHDGHRQRQRHGRPAEPACALGAKQRPERAARHHGKAEPREIAVAVMGELEARVHDPAHGQEDEGRVDPGRQRPWGAPPQQDEARGHGNERQERTEKASLPEVHPRRQLVER